MVNIEHLLIEEVSNKEGKTGQKHGRSPPLGHSGGKYDPLRRERGQSEWDRSKMVHAVNNPE